MFYLCLPPKPPKRLPDWMREYPDMRSYGLGLKYARETDRHNRKVERERKKKR